MPKIQVQEENEDHEIKETEGIKNNGFARKNIFQSEKTVTLEEMYKKQLQTIQRPPRMPLQNLLIGIFFSSDTQTRDYISPKRQILNPFTNSIDECSFNNISVFSQEVPFYQWNIKESNFIFGNQDNDWWTNPVTENGYFKFKYQSLDRLNPDSRYFRTNGSSETQFDKGYIYAVKGNTQNDLSAEIQYWDYNTSPTNVVTVGAPYHFYFGLKKGRSAFDRFRQKWINTEEIIIE
jgi:hypothetical protein